MVAGIINYKSDLRDVSPVIVPLSYDLSTLDAPPSPTGFMEELENIKNIRSEFEERVRQLKEEVRRRDDEYMAGIEARRSARSSEEPQAASAAPAQSRWLLPANLLPFTHSLKARLVSLRHRPASPTSKPSSKKDALEPAERPEEIASDGLDAQDLALDVLRHRLDIGDLSPVIVPISYDIGTLDAPPSPSGFVEELDAVQRIRAEYEARVQRLKDNFLRRDREYMSSTAETRPAEPNRSAPPSRKPLRRARSIRDKNSSRGKILTDKRKSKARSGEVLITSHHQRLSQRLTGGTRTCAAQICLVNDEESFQDQVTQTEGAEVLVGVEALEILSAALKLHA
ncbi:hypothetical protein K525DRAFT_271070 [Schizophyllum commune Loenen D]|nr:hypothetical protein K525DRAFT_271070 [Schizophyllum commune Loenen D]